jgi:hypothetical protein
MINMQLIEALFLIFEIILSGISSTWQPNIRNIWLFKIQSSRRPTFLRTMPSYDGHASS